MGDIDYYFIYGPTVQDVVSRFAQLTGRPAFPPKWSLGYLASGMTYSEVRENYLLIFSFMHIIAFRRRTRKLSYYTSLRIVIHFAYNVMHFILAQDILSYLFLVSIIFNILLDTLQERMGRDTCSLGIQRNSQKLRNL